MKITSWPLFLLLLAISGASSAQTQSPVFALSDGSSISIPMEALSWPAVALVIGLRLGASLRAVAAALASISLRLEVAHSWTGRPMMDCPWDGAERRSTRADPP